jgi:hypothetical protein
MLLPPALGGCTFIAATPPGVALLCPETESLLRCRAELCATEEAYRETLLGFYEGAEDPEQNFERLLLMSCDLYRHHDALEETLQAAALKPDWPADHRAFMEMMATHRQAFTRLEARRQALERQLEDTVRGISEIEEAIDVRPGNN